MTTLGTRDENTSLASTPPSSWVISSSDDAHDHLPGSQALHDVLADCTLAHGGHEVLHDLEVDVGLEQREAYLAHGGVDVVLREPSLAGEVGEDVLESVGEVLEHAGSSVALACVLVKPIR